MKNKTLIILAAGMGSRFGGLKQVEPVGPTGEFIIDYSIFDAKESGFNKIVFVIKKEDFEIFNSTIFKRLEENINVEYVFQDLESLPEWPAGIENRTKPLGTVHALYSAKDVVNEPFLMINADDFYGRESYKKAADFIESNSDEKTLGVVCYKVANTLTKNGSVKRGVCKEGKEGITEIIESRIEKVDGGIKGTSIYGNKTFMLDDDSKVSMNMIVGHPDFFNFLEEELIDFLNNSDILKDEVLVPVSINNAIINNKYKVKPINTNAKWVGVTYKEDKPEVVAYINDQIQKGIYNKELWAKNSSPILKKH